MRAADAIVAVKRLHPYQLEDIRQSGKPWALDVVDLYPQPACTDWDRDTAIKWVRDHIATLSPTAVIWPNKQMREDCCTGLPNIVLPHHYRPKAPINPIREDVRVVGYEGSPNYISEWLEPLTKACAARGWTFIVNPQYLAEVDIVVAFRGREFNGYAQHHWKSNVKLANAHGTGTPFIGPSECGYMETATGLEEWANSPSDLDDCLDRLSGEYHRQQVQKAFLSNRYSVNDAARELSAFMESL